MEALSDVFMLLAHELESGDAGGLLSPFEVVRYAYVRDELREKLIRTFEERSNLRHFEKSAGDLFDSLLEPILCSDEPLPQEALHLWQPLLVLVHEAFGCYRVLEDYERYKSEKPDTPSDILEQIGVHKRLAKHIPCLNASYDIKFGVFAGAIQPQVIGLVLSKPDCKHRARLRQQLGIFRGTEDE